MPQPLQVTEQHLDASSVFLGNFLPMPFKALAQIRQGQPSYFVMFVYQEILFSLSLVLCFHPALLAMSWRPVDFQEELTGIAILLQARPGLPELQNNLCQTVKQKLEKVVLNSSQDLVACYNAVSQSQIPEAMKSQLTSALDQLATSAANASTAQALTSTAQECKTFHKYLSSGDNIGNTSQETWGQGYEGEFEEGMLWYPGLL